MVWKTYLFDNNASEGMTDKQKWSRQGPRPRQVVDQPPTMGKYAVLINSPGKLVLCDCCLISKNQDPGLRTSRGKKIGRPEDGPASRVIHSLERALPGKESPKFGGCPAIVRFFFCVRSGWGRPGPEGVALEPVDEDDTERG